MLSQIYRYWKLKKAQLCVGQYLGNWWTGAGAPGHQHRKILTQQIWLFKHVSDVSCIFKISDPAVYIAVFDVIAIKVHPYSDIDCLFNNMFR